MSQMERQRYKNCCCMSVSLQTCCFSGCTILVWHHHRYLWYAWMVNYVAFHFWAENKSVNSWKWCYRKFIWALAMLNKLMEHECINNVHSSWHESEIEDIFTWNFVRNSSTRLEYIYKTNWIHSHSACSCDIASYGHTACLIASGSQILRVPDLSCIPLYCAAVKVSTIWTSSRPV